MGNSPIYRPDKIDDLVGLEHVKSILKYDIAGSKILRQNMPSYLVAGPSGSGKSTIAGMISNLTGGQVYKSLGSELKKDDNVYSIAQVVKDNDIVYIEEAHSISKNAQMVLLEWIENFKLLGGGNGGMDAPKVCFILPTTNPGKIGKPLRERCRTLYTSYYKVSELELILANAGRHFGVDLTTCPEALSLLARCSRGTPRTAISNRLDNLRKVMAVDGLPYNLTTVQLMLNLNKINEWGLEMNDLKYAETAYLKIVSNKNRPVSKRIIQQATGLDEDVVDNVIEPYLQQIGVIQVQHGGRMITPFGCEVIDQEPIVAQPPSNKILEAIATTAGLKDIDSDELKTFVQDPSHPKMTMEMVASKFGLRPGTDNSVIRVALEKIGYTARRRAGIIPQD